jgi:hypothetical protein
MDDREFVEYMYYLGSLLDGYKISEEELIKRVESNDTNDVNNHFGINYKRVLARNILGDKDYLRNNLEKEFVRQWIYENNLFEANNNKFLADVILNKHCDPHELEIVNSVIQWLGTNFGVKFVKNVLTKENYDKF